MNALVPYCFTELYVMDEISFRGANITTCPAFDTIHQTPVSGILDPSVFHKIGYTAWQQLHRTYVDTPRAGNTDLLIFQTGGFIVENENPRSPFDYGYLISYLTDSHHRTAVDDFRCRL